MPIGIVNVPLAGTTAEAMNVLPEPLAPAGRSATNSSTVQPGQEMPVTSLPAEVSTGKFSCWFAPASASPASFGFTAPIGARSMPSPPPVIEKMLFWLIVLKSLSKSSMRMPTGAFAIVLPVMVERWAWNRIWMPQFWFGMEVPLEATPIRLFERRVPDVETPSIVIWPSRLSPKTLPSITVPWTPSSTCTPSSLLCTKEGMALPVRSVPMKLSTMRLPTVFVVWETSMPSPALPESTFPSPGPLPPMMFWEAPRLMSMPIRRLRMRFVPAGLRPMMLFWIRFALVPTSVK